MDVGVDTAWYFSCRSVEDTTKHETSSLSYRGGDRYFSETVISSDEKRNAKAWHEHLLQRFTQNSFAENSFLHARLPVSLVAAPGGLAIIFHGRYFLCIAVVVVIICGSVSITAPANNGMAVRLVDHKSTSASLFSIYTH